MATTVPVTGLSQLGNVLLQGSADYANQRLRREAEERQRAQQLADLQSQRTFQQQQMTAADQRARDLALWQARQQRIQELIAKGFLAQAQANDEAAIAAADAAEQARTTKLRTETDTARVNMQGSANEIGDQINRLSDAAAQVQARLAAIPTRPAAPDPRQVEAMAVQLATEAGEDPKADAVRAKYRGAAEKVLTDAAMRDFFIAQEASDALKVSLQGYTNQIASLTRRLEGYERSGIVPTVRAPAQTLQSDFAPAAPTLRRATPDEQAAAAGLSPVSVAPSSVAPSPVASLQDQSYGGVMGLAPEIRTAGAALENLPGAVEIGARQALSPLARILNYVAGGERRVREGEAERASGMASAEERFRAPARPIGPGFPFYVPPTAPSPNALQPLPPLPKIKPANPAFRFSDSFAPGY